LYGVFFTPLSGPTYDRLAPLGVAPDVAPSVARDFADGYQHLDDLQEWFNHSAPTKCSAAYKRWLAGRAYVHRAGDMTHQQPVTNADRRLCRAVIESEYALYRLWREHYHRRSLLPTTEA
jgi:hypothetical protein